MWMLLGDPALQLPLLSLDNTIEVIGNAVPGGWITLKGFIPDDMESAQIQMTLERPLESIFNAMDSSRNQIEKDPVDIELSDLRMMNKGFECRIKIPTEIQWPNAILRVYSLQENRGRMGVLTLPIEQPANSRSKRRM